MVTLFFFNALATITIMVLLWALSRLLQDVSIVDIYWGPGFVVIALITLAQAPILTLHNLILASMVCLWGLRLGFYMYGRWQKKAEEDPRYAAMRRNRSPNFERSSLWVVFLLQAGIMWIVSAPIQLAIGSGSDTVNGLLLGVGLALYALGMIFEVVGDAQLARFRSDPANNGRVMDKGLWSWTRHPNYFGDAAITWSFFLVAVSGVSGAVWTIFAPVIMTYFLLRVSGVALMERGLSKTKPGYADYAKRTSVFIPMPPKGIQ